MRDKLIIDLQDAADTKLSMWVDLTGGVKTVLADNYEMCECWLDDHHIDQLIDFLTEIRGK